MSKCNNCGRYMDGFGIICGVCKDNEKIQDGQAEMQRQLAANAREAERASERQMEAVQSAKRQARVQHAEAMRAEADRLEELQKQTQILLEGQITNEDAYQRGFDLEDEYLNLLISEDGRVYWEIYEPYLVARLNAAYQRGAQDRLEKEFESNYPGLEYMKQEAFGHGYAGSINCSIVYLHHLPHIYPAKLNVLTETGLIQVINQKTGELEWQWMPAFMSEGLNDAYDSGAEKYLNEQNTAELVAERLEKFKEAVKKAEDLAKQQAEGELVKEKSNESARNTINSIIALTALLVLIALGYMYFANQHQPLKDISKMQKIGGGIPRDIFESKIKKDGWVLYRSYRDADPSNSLRDFKDYRNATIPEKIRHVTYDGCNSNVPRANTNFCKYKPAFYEEAIQDEILEKSVADGKYRFPPLVNVLYIDIGTDVTKEEALALVEEIKASNQVINSSKKFLMNTYKWANWDDKETNLIEVWDFKNRAEARKYLPLFSPYGDVYMGFSGH